VREASGHPLGDHGMPDKQGEAAPLVADGENRVSSDDTGNSDASYIYMYFVINLQLQILS
jgi:hypothetical protein